MIGTHFAEFRILDKIGGGNTGVVYKAWDPDNERYVALKVLTNDFLLTKEKKARFQRETHAAFMMKHPNIATLYTAGEYRNYSYLCMEYIEGVSYSQIIESNPDGIALGTFYLLMLPVLEGMAYAHERNLAHRDIKPDNLKLGDNNQAKILDFGLVKFLDSDESGSGDSFRTMNGMVIGSAGYMSPEQAAGQPLDKRTDIFSLGILMYELLSGRNPFQAANAFATINKILTATPVSLELLRPELPMRLSEAVLKCLNKRMEQRFPDAGALYQTIADIKG